MSKAIKDLKHYELAVKKRTALHTDYENAMDYAAALFKQLNDLEDSIDEYETEQAALDE